MTAHNSCKELIIWSPTFPSGIAANRGIKDQDLYLLLRGLSSTFRSLLPIPAVRIVAPADQISPFSPSAYSFLPLPLASLRQIPTVLTVEKALLTKPLAPVVPSAVDQPAIRPIGHPGKEVPAEIMPVNEADEVVLPELRYIWITQPVRVSPELEMVEDVSSVGPAASEERRGEGMTVPVVAITEVIPVVNGEEASTIPEGERAVVPSSFHIEVVEEVEMEEEGTKEAARVEDGSSDVEIGAEVAEAMGVRAAETAPDESERLIPELAVTETEGGTAQAPQSTISEPRISSTSVDIPAEPHIESPNLPIPPPSLLSAGPTPTPATTEVIPAAATTSETAHTPISPSLETAPAEQPVTSIPKISPPPTATISTTPVDTTSTERLSETHPAEHRITEMPQELASAKDTPEHLSPPSASPEASPLPDTPTQQPPTSQHNSTAHPAEPSPRSPGPSQPTSPILPRPTFSSSATPAPTRIGLKRKDTMEDLFSAMVPIKRKKVELVVKRKEPESPLRDIGHDDMPQEIGVEGGSMEESSAPEEHTDAHISDDELEPIYDAQKGQWRVGRLPGHQGSHIRRHELGEERNGEGGKRGQKRSLGQNINDSAEKVLKKPFRLPARVVLKPSIAKHRSASPPPTVLSPHPDNASVSTSSPAKPSSTSSSTKPPTPKISSRPFAVPRKITKPVFSELFPSATTPKSTSTSASTASTQTPSSPPSTSTTLSSPFKSSPTYSKRLSKPFKTPFSRSAAPSPASTRSKAKSSRDAIAELEKEERTLRNAIKYHTQPEEDERLVQLIRIWREAGQTVAELLFDIQPKPDPNAPADGGQGSFFGGGGGGGGEKSFFAQVEYTPEQLRQLARMRTNKDGDPIDDDGNPVFGTGDDGAELDLGDGSNGMRRGDEDRVDDTTKTQDSDEWTIGTMLAKMGVEPSMYAWDADAEDWGVPEED